MKKWVSILMVMLVLLTGCSAHKQGTIKTGKLRATAFALVSSAENSTTDYPKQYAYIEDIGDGRGYTGGIIGFTSRTGDMFDVVRKYVELRPHHNGLVKYLSALKAVKGTDSHQGLGQPFEQAWQKAAHDKEFIAAQNAILNRQYLNVALRYARRDQLGPLGQYIYYDALVVHGPGTTHDKTSFQGIRRSAWRLAKTPAQGGDEGKYLNAFLDARTPIMKREKAHRDLSRLKVQRRLIREKKFNLQLPLRWTMYGDKYHLTEKDVLRLEKQSE
ncbi:csn protein [Lactobacillus selangorensis]|uniref:Chitosanase n=1 Tax=Lactobacillus selangorensis TaxID=81857 RepID=A0A0R2FM29_9LACO|nr:chitosanase [Lactobacillus selangorensis]KRN28763.1 csn protein [Lactobacillus selangorensis]KRN32827.1 csn protein [Lactobacillus selangorensis]